MGERGFSRQQIEKEEEVVAVKLIFSFNFYFIVIS